MPTDPTLTPDPSPSPEVDRAQRPWRVGVHYGIHVYAGDRPVATFHNAYDAAAAVDAINRVDAAKLDVPPDRDAWAIVSPETGRLIVNSVRSSEMACLLCLTRDHKLDGKAFRAARYRCVPVDKSVRAIPAALAQLGAETEERERG